MTKQRMIWLTASVAATSLVLYFLPNLMMRFGERKSMLAGIVFGFVCGIIVTLNNAERAKRAKEAVENVVH